ncbi:MAG: bacteriohemerythrin [Pseudomonadota bacterium]
MALTDNSIDIFPWDDNFNTGLPKVDEQHRKLVQLLNVLASHVAFQSEIPQLSEIFEELANYTVYHFQTEEAIWNTYLGDDPAEVEHRATHACFVDEVVRLKADLGTKPLAQLTEEALAFLARWLASHILETDRYMAYAVLAMQEGLSLDAAKQRAREQMGGATRALIDIILSIYSTLSTNTLRLMRELAAHRVAEIELKQTRDQLRLRERYQRAVLDNFPFLVWLKDTEGRFLAVNQPFALACGQATPDTVIGKTDLDIWPADLAERYRADDQEVLRSGKPKHVEEAIEGAGGRAWFETYKSSVDIDGKAIGTVGFARDVSERKNAERQVAKAYALLNEAVSNIANGFTIYDEQDRLVICNEAYLDFYRTSRDLIVPGTTFEEIVRKGAARGQYKEASGRIDAWVQERVRKHQEADGSQIEQHLDDGRWLLIIEHRTPSGFIVGNRIDITARKQAEAELEHYRHNLESLVEERTIALSSAKELAEAANRAKTTFLANMSHELRTPLNAIMGMTALALRHAVEPKLHAQLGKIDQASRHLLTVINDILDISKIEADRMELEQTDFRLGDLLEHLDTLVGDRALDEGLKFAIDLPENLADLQLCGDALHLGQVLLNLASNAIKFTERGAVVVAVRQTGVSASGHTLRFEVRDTGTGIAPEDQSRLFKPFSQADSSMTRKYGGTGLGLAISKRLVELMEGEIGVSSQPGVGSTFWFSVRLRPGSGHEIPATGAVLPAPTFEKRLQREYGGAHILLAEDEPINREVALCLLEDTGLIVDVAVDGQEALDLARHHRYALILMDMQMPRLNGIEATRAIRTDSLNLDTPILAMTANAFDDDRQACLSAGMNAHLPKPVEPEVLFETLYTWLNKPPH